MRGRRARMTRRATTRDMRVLQRDDRQGSATGSGARRLQGVLALPSPLNRRVARATSISRALTEVLDDARIWQPDRTGSIAGAAVLARVWRPLCYCEREWRYVVDSGKTLKVEDGYDMWASFISESA